MPQDMFLQGEKLSTSESEAPMFNEYFQSIFSNHDQSSNQLHGETDCVTTNPDLESITATEQEVVHFLQHLDHKQCTGPETFLQHF